MGGAVVERFVGGGVVGAAVVGQGTSGHEIFPPDATKTAALAESQVIQI